MIETRSELIRVRDKSFRPFISRDEIALMVQRIAAKMNHDFAGQEIVALVVLKGAMVFASDLIRELNVPLTVEFLHASSYANAMKSKGSVDIEERVVDVEGKNVVIIEDIIDSGLTMLELIKQLSSLRPASISIASLLSKPEVHAERIEIDYLGQEIPPYFVVGYGLDYAGHGRQLDGIWVVTEDETT